MPNYQIKRVDHFAAIFKALSNPHRLQLFQQLAGCCPPGTACSVGEAVRCTVGTLAEPLDIAPSTLSHHLKELKQAGLVRMERRGKHVECWVDGAVLDELALFFKPE